MSKEQQAAGESKTQWSKKSDAAENLIKAFELFSKDPNFGINPDLSSAKEIRTKVLDKHQWLQKYNRQHFPNNFKNLARDFKFNLQNRMQMQRT